jgi:gliding motility-associated-like protein
MRKLLRHLYTFIPLILISFFSYQVNAQTISLFNFTIRNDVQVSDRILEFDLYLLDSDVTEPFELNMVQAGILVNPGIYNGGTVSVTRVLSTSELVTAQQPAAANILWSQAQNCIKVTSKLPTPLGEGTILSQTAPGTRVCRLRITNTTAFTPSSTANLTFNFTVSPYPTKVFQTTEADPDGIELVCTAANCFSNAANIILNPPLSSIPTATPGTICAGANVQLNAGASGGSGSYTYSWTSIPAGFSSTNAAPIANPSVNIIYYVNVSDGSTNLNSQVGVTVNANPTALVLTGSTICVSPGGNGTITSSTSVGGVNYQLYNSANAMVQGAQSGNGSGLSWSTLPAGNGYYVIATNGATCTATSTPVNVSATSNPVALVLTGSTICLSPGGNGTITSTTSVSGVSYQLYNVSNAPVQTPKAGTGSGLAWSGLIAGNGYYVIGTNASSCLSPSSNTVNVSTTPNPAALVLTGSTICVSPGGNGTITSTTSVSGVNYQLYNVSNAPVQTAKAGTGSGLSWSGLAAGNGYYVIGTNASSCVSPASNAVNILTTPNPISLILTGSTICVSPGGNGTITSTTSVSGVSYQLFNSANAMVQGAQTGTGSGLAWSSLTAGTGYYVIATNGASCTSTSTPVNISTTSNPAVLILTGSTICVSPGGNGTITSSTSVGGVNYQLYNSANAMVQGVQSGTGSGLTWSTLPAGNGYYVIATNGATCTATSSPVNVSTTPNPVSLVLTGSTICVSPGGNGTVTSTTSVIGVNYQLYNVSNTPVQTPKAGTGSGLAWSGLAAGNGYYVIGTNASSCVSPSSNAVNILTTPNPVSLILTGSTICVSPGGNGTITSSTSVGGVNYQLYNSANAMVQGAQSGTGSGLTWSTLPAGNGYYVIGTNASSCVSSSSNAVNILTTPNPVSLILTGSTICVSPGGNGTITSTTSVSGVSYQLFNSANAMVQSAQTGTGSGLAWSSLTAGTGYYVIATNGASCTSTSTPVNISTTPNPAVLILTGSTICLSPGGNGTITSTTSVSGVSYQLYNVSNAPVQTPKAGTGSGLAWAGLIAGNGYYVIGTNASSCLSPASNAVNVSTTSNPIALVLTGSTICVSPGGNGTITSTTSVSGVSYQLYNSANAMVQGAQSGNGSGLAWSGLAAGNGYYVIATNGATCTATSSPVNVSTTPNPVSLVLTGSTICLSPGGNGTITSTTSVSGVSYQLYNVSNAPVQTPKAGTGSGLAWSALAAGSGYYVIGTNASSCLSPASNAVNVSTTSNPIALVLTGSDICVSPGGNGTITSTTSVNGVSYQLYNVSNAPVQTPKAGSGSGLSWASLAAGNGYYVIATNAATCTATSTPVNVTTIPNPIALVLTGSTICVSPGGNGTITSTSSVSGVNYQLYDISNAPVQTPKAGTGSGLAWSGLAAGNGYYVIGTNASSCVSPASNAVNILTTPNPVSLILTGSTICVSPGGNGTITSTTSVSGVSYQLYNSANAMVQGAQSGSGSGLTWSSLAAGTGYYMIATNGATCTATSTPVNVSTTPNPVALVLTGSTICVSPGGNGTITSTSSVSGVNYQLYNVSNAPVQTPKAGTGSGLAWSGLVAGNGYYVIGTNASSCVSPASNAVNVSTTPNPAALVLTGSTICVSPGGNGTITSGTSVIGINYQLYNSVNTAVQPAQPGIGSALIWSGLSADNGYYVVGTNATTLCISANSNSVNVTATPNPTAPFVGTITQPTCTVATGSVILNGLPGSGTWTLTRNPGGITSTGTGTSTTITGLTGGTTYTYTVTNAAACISPLSADILINSQPPTPVVINQTTSIVNGTSFSVNPSGVPGGTTYTWLTPTYTNGVDGGNAQSVPQSNISGSLIIPSGTGTATYIVTPTSGTCIGATFTVTVTVTSSCVPVTIVSNPVNDDICTNSGTASFTVIAGQTFPFTYQWKYYNGSAWVNVSNGTPAGAVYSNWTTATLSVSGITVAGNYQYQCYVTNCVSSTATSATAVLTVNIPPSAPAVGGITQPTCTVSTGSVVLNGLPATGTWTLIRTPGSVVTNGSGTSYTIDHLASGTTYSYTVTNAAGCTSTASSYIVIDPQPSTPLAPLVGTITAPTCTITTGSVVLSGLPPSGTWTLTRLPGAVTTTGMGTVTTISGLPTGSYNYTVTNSGNCVSAASATVIIPAQPPQPSAPIVGTVTQPTCVTATGSVVLSGLPSGTWIINPGAIAGSNTSTTLSGIPAGTYNYTYTDAAGCTSLATTNVVINVQPPTPVVTNQTTTISSGGSFNITPTGVPGGTTYTWTAPTYTGGVTEGIAQAVPQSNISGTLNIPSGTGTAVYIVTPTAGTCTGANFSVTITVTSSCVPVTVSTQPSGNGICATSGSSTFTVAATGTAPFNYQWQYYNGSSWNNVVNGTPAGASYSNSTTVTLGVSGITSAGNYQYRCYITNCSGSTNATSNSAILTVNPLPAAPSSSTITQPTCALPTGSVVLNNLPAGNWTINPGAVTGSSTSTSLSGLVPGTYAYTVTNSLNCTSLISSNIVILTEPGKPAAPVAGTITQPTCNLATGSIILTGLPTGAWTVNPGNISGTGSSTTISGLVAGTYNYTVTNSIGCTSVLSSDIVINSQPITPTVVITNPEAVCSPSVVDLTASAVTGGSTSGLIYTYWTNASATVTYATPASAVAGTYYIKGTTTAGCFDIKPVIAIVNPLPSANAGTGGSECDLDFVFSAVSGIGTGTWSLTSGPGTATFIPDANTAGATVTVSAYGSYTFTWTEASNGCSNSSAVTVIFNQQPVANAGTGGNNCGLGITLSAVPSVGTGIWTKTSGPGTVTFTPDANSPTARATVSLYGNYTFTWTEVNGSCTNNASVNVNFLQVPVANAGIDSSVCKLEYGLNATTWSATGTGLWTKLSGPGSVIFTPDATQPGAKVTVDQAGTYEFTWTEYNGTCLASDIVQVIFRSLPFVSAGNDTTICISDNIQLKGAGTGSFLWEPAAMIINPALKTPEALPLSSTTFKVTLTDQYGCKNSDEVFVEVIENPVANAGPDMVLDYLFTLEMAATEPASDVSGLWSLVSGTAEFDDNTKATAIVTGLSLGENILLWSVDNGVCPVANDYLSVTVNNLVIPTLITPNMDGKNDYFVLRGIQTLGRTELVIFDRRGAQIYKNSDYDNSWNGVDQNDKPVPSDTYFYSMKTESGKTYKGYIVVRR